MEIIKPGIVDKQWHGPWTCHQCGCEWKLDDGDKEPSFILKRPGNKSLWQMYCPQVGCNALVTLYKIENKVENHG